MMKKDRRKFLQGAGAALGLLAAGGRMAFAAPSIAKSPNGKALAGVFPIGWTPCKPDNSFDADAIVYFKALADASGLPMMVQAVGDVSVDSLLALAQAIPSVVAVKDEAGDPLERAPDLLKKSGGRLEDFSGGGGMTFFAELELGFLGTWPYTGLADVL